MQFELKPQQPEEKPQPRFTFKRVPGGRANVTYTGTFEAGVTEEEIDAKLRGPFGGTFELFGDGLFRYIAYMD